MEDFTKKIKAFDGETVKIIDVSNFIEIFVIANKYDRWEYVS